MLAPDIGRRPCASLKNMRGILADPGPWPPVARCWFVVRVDCRLGFVTGTLMPVATLTGKGQTTIPKQVLERLKLNPGDKLNFVIEAEGRVVIRPAKLDVRELKGLLKRSAGKTLSIEDMNDAIARDGGNSISSGVYGENTVPGSAAAGVVG
jgi:antitoxin PrlF